MANNSEFEYVYPTYARQSKKTAKSFTPHRDAAGRNSKGNESSGTPNDKITFFVEKYNTLEQWIETAERLNSFFTSPKHLWKEEAVRLIKELNDVSVNAE